MVAVYTVLFEIDYRLNISP